MSAHLPFLSRLLAFVLALTVLAPGFGWEMAGEAAGHARNETAHALKHAAGDAHEACALHDGGHASEHAGCATPEQCASTQHHCCPGHTLGHVPVYLAAAPKLSLLTVTQAMIRADAAVFTSRVPQGLERPPKHAAT